MIIITSGLGSETFLGQARILDPHGLHVLQTDFQRNSLFSFTAKKMNLQPGKRGMSVNCSPFE
jgi:hypothetical protein